LDPRPRPCPNQCPVPLLWCGRPGRTKTTRVAMCGRDARTTKMLQLSQRLS